ncbi:FkbM family methyltransferase [Candidatus Frankia alpina]|uniref:FkbM family methyltransferase n=1 Tax=Candidatus Frankia alpina TaxID=2699483 RepID=UPI0019686A7C|nr:FkbM family methyltransferase [Candidatus Frankia alpina]
MTHDVAGALGTAPEHRGGPLRWRLAGRLAGNLPDLRGRDRLTRWVHGPGDGYTGPLRGRLTNGMTFSVDDCRDGSARDLVALRYRPPALAAVFDTILAPGDCCYDVGANIGIYTLWAAGAVGPDGEVHAFEPVPQTRATLTSLVEQNGLTQVRLSPTAVGATIGRIGLRLHPGASGLTHQVSDGATPDLTVPVVTLDSHAARHRPPTLIKIDVEGFELEVLRGAQDLLRTHRPALLLEMLPSHLARRGSSYQKDLVSLLSAVGYRIFNLTRDGLSGQGTFSSNVLALHDGWERFARVAATLRRTPLPRNQTT